MSNMQQTQPQFDAEAIGELIDLAARLDDLAAGDGLSYDQLVRIGAEVGISRAAIDRAVATDRTQRRHVEKQARKRVKRRMRFVRHAVVYVIVVSSLALIDGLNGGGWWFYYVGAIWGAALALQGTRFLTRRSGPLEEAMLEREQSLGASRQLPA